MQVVTIETPSLGDRSYLVHDGAVALVVDTQRDIDRVFDAASGAGARLGTERSDGFIAGSTHIPLGDLLARLDDVPAGPVWVHCTSGYRASIAASLLDRAGREVVLVDDDVACAGPAGLPIRRSARHRSG